MDHSDEPTPGDLPEEELSSMYEGLMGSEYYRYVEPLAGIVRGKRVAGSRGGTSGYSLAFAGGSWFVAYLVGERLAWQTGPGDVPPEVLGKIDSAEAGDASEPLDVDLPYAGQACDIASEVARCHGQPVVGLAYGEDTFNLCFPKGMELEAMIVPDRDGRPALRVFWEQW